MKQATIILETLLGEPLTVRWSYEADSPDVGLGIELDGPEAAVALAKAALESRELAWAPELGHQMRGPAPDVWGWTASVLSGMALGHRSVFVGTGQFNQPEGLELPELGDDELM
jgi:hypothetical protein